jgi:hypothetical protein
MCKSTNQTIKKHVSLSFSKSQCFGDCPVYDATIYRNGKIEIDGKANVNNIGTNVYQDEDYDISEIFRLADKIKFEELEERYNTHVRDISRTTIKFKDKTIVVGLKNGKQPIPSALLDLIEKIEKTIYNKITIL